jgi:hypothetical protein
VTHVFDDGIQSLTDTVTQPGHEEYDALADLFLGQSPALRLTERDPEETNRASPAPTASASRVEALVLGHLPVLAGAWAAQHARSLAEETGRPTALVRLSTDHASVDLFGNRDLTSHGERWDSLEDAFGFASDLGVRWLLRVDAPFELELASAAGVDKVCLLSGVDDAAVVAAYRTLKGLHEALPEDVESGQREISLRLMGAGEPESHEAQAKLARVSRAFLSCDVHFLPASSRIDAGSGRTLYRGSYDGDFRSVLKRIRCSPHASSRPTDPGESASPPPPPAQSPPEVTRPDSHEQIAPDDVASLAERLGLDGLSVRCAAAPEIELAADGQGRLHLLGIGAESAADLLAAEGWARTNLDLIGAAAGDRPLREILARVLTDRPSRDRRLLDGRFRVDLLQEVRVGERTAWCCVPLNADD